MVVVIDNYDSFTYNLVQYVRELGNEVAVFRNDQITVEELAQYSISHLIVSPGPGTPDDAGVSMQAIQYFSGKIPVLGVCLGHQSIGQAFGASIGKAKTMMHGKTSSVFYEPHPVFQDVPLPFRATRYHSLVINPGSLPECLEAIAWSDDGEIMGVQHKQYAVTGVQFHPESILTEGGKQMIQNFLNQRERVTA